MYNMVVLNPERRSTCALCVQSFKIKYFKVNSYKGEFITEKRGVLCARVGEEGRRIKQFGRVVGSFVCLGILWVFFVVLVWFWFGIVPSHQFWRIRCCCFQDITRRPSGASAELGAEGRGTLGLRSVPFPSPFPALLRGLFCANPWMRTEKAEQREPCSLMSLWRKMESELFAHIDEAACMRRQKTTG